MVVAVALFVSLVCASAVPEEISELDSTFDMFHHGYFENVPHFYEIHCRSMSRDVGMYTGSQRTVLESQTTL